MILLEGKKVPAKKEKRMGESAFEGLYKKTRCGIIGEVLTQIFRSGLNEEGC